jgi:DnaK suppressor protein
MGMPHAMEPYLRLLRDQLADRRGQLKEQLDLRLVRIRETGGDRAPEDAGDAAHMDIVMVDMLTAMLRRIEQAIERIDDGRYGRCKRCRRPIGDARLRAMPFAVHCQPCETAREHDTLLRSHRNRQRKWEQPDEPEDTVLLAR